MAQRGRSTLSSTSALDYCGWSTPHPDRFTPGKDPVPIVQEAGWATGPVLKVAENLAPPTGIRSPDRPAHSESLYRVNCRGPPLIHEPRFVLFCLIGLMASWLWRPRSSGFWRRAVWPIGTYILKESTALFFPQSAAPWGWRYQVSPKRYSRQVGRCGMLFCFRSTA